MKHVQDSSAEGFQRLSRDWVAECCTIVDEHRDAIEMTMPRETVKEPIFFILFHPSFLLFLLFVCDVNTPSCIKQRLIKQTECIDSAGNGDQNRLKAALSTPTYRRIT